MSSRRVGRGWGRALYKSIASIIQMWEGCTSVVVELPVVHVDDVGAHAVHEVLGVGDHDEDALEVAEHLLQPNAGFQVQVVGGLVQDAAARTALSEG